MLNREGFMRKVFLTILAATFTAPAFSQADGVNEAIKQCRAAITKEIIPRKDIVVSLPRIKEKDTGAEFTFTWDGNENTPPFLLRSPSSKSKGGYVFCRVNKRSGEVTRLNIVIPPPVE